MVVSGCILQLSAIGAQNAYINSNQYTLFKTGIRSFTNFAAGQIIVSPQSSTSGYFGSELTFKVPRSGDLIHKTYFSAVLSGLSLNSAGSGYVSNSGVQWVQDVGRSLIEYVQLDIGGTKFDKILGEHLMIEFDLENASGKEDDFVTGTPPAIGGGLSQADWSKSSQRIFVELPFWFDRFTEQALPIIALMFHDVDIKIKLRNQSDVVQLTPSNNSSWTPSGVTFGGSLPITHPEYLPEGDSGATDTAITTWPVVYAGAANVSMTAAGAVPLSTDSGSINDPVLCITYIFLDQLERKLFAGSGHEYVIKQHQHIGVDSRASNTTNVSYTKNFSHPISEFSVVMRRTNATATAYNKNYRDFSGLPIDTRYNGTYGSGSVTKYFGSVLGSNDMPMESWQLSLNNHSRLVDRNGWGVSQYRYVIPRESHSKIPSLFMLNYSFALRPENLLATGTLNCSRIDNIQFTYTFNQYMTALEIYVFAKNFNVVKISSGLAGLRFSS